MPLNAAELLLTLDRTSGVPMRRRLAMALREAVRAGQLAAASTMPSSRILAKDLGLSRGVVVDAYAQLVAEGYLESVPGSGTRVVARAVAAHPPQAPSSPPRQSSESLDLRPGAPDLAAFPRGLWLGSMRAVLQNVPSDELGYVEPWGCWALRAQLAGYLARVRGAMCRPEDVVVVTGATQGITLLMRVLAAAGEQCVAVEDPSNAVQRQVLRRYGLEVLDVPVDDEGIQVDALARSGARAVLVTPAHQYPSGTVLSAQRRSALLQWAKDRQGLVIEDDYDSEFRYDRDPVGCLQGLDPAHVALIGSVSKSLAPGLRLGWVLSPPTLLAELQAAKRDDDFGTPVLEQHTLARLLDGGGYDRHLRQVRRHYRQRRNALVEALGHDLPEWLVMGSAAGLHLVVHLSEGCPEAAVVSAAAERGILLLGLAAMRGTYPGPPGLVLSYARHPPEQLTRAVKQIASALAGIGSEQPQAAPRARQSSAGTSGADYFG